MSILPRLLKGGKLRFDVRRSSFHFESFDNLTEARLMDEWIDESEAMDKEIMASRAAHPSSYPKSATDDPWKWPTNNWRP